MYKLTAKIKYLKTDYFYLIVEKGFKICISYVVIFFMREKYNSILSTYAILEATSITLQVLSFFGTDILSQREIRNRGENVLYEFINARFFISIPIFIMSFLLVNSYVGQSFSIAQRLILCSFILLSPLQAFEFYLYAKGLFKIVYLRKILSYIISLGVKLILLFYYPQLVIYSIPLDFILLYLLLSATNLKMVRNIKISSTSFISFFKNYWKNISILFLGSILVSSFTPTMYKIIRLNSNDRVLSNLYGFLKVSEGLNFLSTNIGIMVLPKKRVSLFLLKEIRQLINVYRSYFIFFILGIYSSFVLLFYILNFDNLLFISLLSLVLFATNSYHTLLGINSIFINKLNIKTFLNLTTYVLLFMMLLVQNDSFWNYIIILIVIKISAVLIVRIFHKKYA